MQRRVWSPRGSMGSEHLGQVREGEGWWTGSRSLREDAMPNWELVRRREKNLQLPLIFVEMIVSAMATTRCPII